MQLGINCTANYVHYNILCDYLRNDICTSIKQSTTDWFIKCSDFLSGYIFNSLHFASIQLKLVVHISNSQ